jgi:hypothetical protein
MSTPPHPFRVAVESRDLEGMVGQLADDVVLWSPLAFTPFEGKAQVSRLLEVLMSEVFQDFRYTDELVGDDGTHALVFRTRVGDREVQGLDLLRFDTDGLVIDFTVMVRPASAMQALGAAVAPRYAYITGE